MDKFSKCEFTKQEASVISCPIIAECPLTLECKVKEIVPLGSHDMFIAEIVAIDVADDLLDGDGKLHLERARLAAYAHGEYFELGKSIGTFGFSVKKKNNKSARPRSNKGKKEEARG